jgi:hypothetical protein
LEKILLIGTNDLLIHNIYDDLITIYKKENIYLVLLNNYGYYKIKYENKIIINNFTEIDNIIKLFNPEKILFSIPNFKNLYTDNFIIEITQISLIVKENNGHVVSINYLNDKLKKILYLFDIPYLFIDNVYSEYDYYTKINHDNIIKNIDKYKHISQYYKNFININCKNEEECYKIYLDWYKKNEQSLFYQL